MTQLWKRGWKTSHRKWNAKCRNVYLNEKSNKLSEKRNIWFCAMETELWCRQVQKLILLRHWRLVGRWQHAVTSWSIDGGTCSTWGVAASSLSTKTMTVPSVILVFSGKRKSGKDFITDLLQDRYYQNFLSLFEIYDRVECETCSMSDNRWYCHGIGRLVSESGRHTGLPDSETNLYHLDFMDKIKSRKLLCLCRPTILLNTKYIYIYMIYIYTLCLAKLILNATYWLIKKL